MGNYLYQLERYNGSKTKHRCCMCGQKSLTLYINSETGEYLADYVGRCDREIKCGYHYKPKQFFEDNNLPFNVTRVVVADNYKTPGKPKPVFIPSDVLESTLQKNKSLQHISDTNIFVRFLIELFGIDITSELIAKYFIGSSRRWQGSTIFWFIDIDGNIRAGQIKLFDPDGHTSKYAAREGEIISCTTWIHKALEWKYNKDKSPIPEWLTKYIKQYEKITCLFGEHLLQSDKAKPVAIVEAPKTAIIASVFFPEFVWLAVSSLSYLTIERCKVLQGRRVVLFPDASVNGSAFETWNKKSIELRAKGISATVSDVLERNATDEEKKAGADLADYLVKFNYQEFISSKLPEKQPDIKQEIKREVFISLGERRPELFSGDLPIDNWSNEITELESFFRSVTLPNEAIRLNNHSVITNPELFVETNLEIIKANNGNKGYLPYMERLMQLKEILTNERVIQ